MKDELSFPAFTHDSIAGYCNGNPLYAQYKNDKKSKYIGTKQMWQELSKLRCDLEFFKEEQDRSATALIERTKELDKCQKDLEIARKALEELKECRFQGGEQSVKLGVRVVAQAAIEQIEHKE